MTAVAFSARKKKKPRHASHEHHATTTIQSVTVESSGPHSPATFETPPPGSTSHRSQTRTRGRKADRVAAVNASFLVNV
ncbi:hypothetical protein M404DRAFT_996213, partial [Pisolithus tinctorius Marx 270]